MDAGREPSGVPGLGDPSEDAHGRVARRSLDGDPGDAGRVPSARRAVGVPEDGASRRRARDRPGGGERGDDHGGLDHDGRLPRRRRGRVGRREVVAAVRVHRPRGHRGDAPPGPRRRIRCCDAHGGFPRERPSPPRHAQRVRDADRPALGQLAYAPDLTWDDLAWIREAAPVPLFVKGIMTAEDARIAVEVGVDGIVVSNHGGRQLDSVHAPITVFPEVVEAVAGRVPVLVDGGFRRGTDVFKALALGANAAMVARPVCWGLAVAGGEGVADALRILRMELENAMALAGTRTVADIIPTLVD